MNILVYTGGKIQGYELEIGEKLTFIRKREYKHMGITVRLNVLRSLDQEDNIYVTARELLKSFHVIN